MRGIKNDFRIFYEKLEPREYWIILYASSARDLSVAFSLQSRFYFQFISLKVIRISKLSWQFALNIRTMSILQNFFNNKMVVISPLMLEFFSQLQCSMPRQASRYRVSELCFPIWTAFKISFLQINLILNSKKCLILDSNALPPFQALEPMPPIFNYSSNRIENFPTPTVTFKLRLKLSN